jgi:hypothetical protein
MHSGPVQSPKGLPLGMTISISRAPIIAFALVTIFF